MATTQKSFIALALALAIGIGLYEARRVSRLQAEARALLLQQESLADQNQRLQSERDQAASRLAAAQPVAARSHDDASNLLKLRAEVTKLRGDSRELAQLNAAAAAKSNDPTEAEIKSWMERVNTLKAKLGQRPDQKIPEFQFLTEQDWLDSVRDNQQLETEPGLSKALNALRDTAKGKFADALQTALRNYAQAANGQSPTDWSQLKPYFGSAVDDSVLQRYEFTQPGTVTAKTTSLVGPDDKYYEISMNTISSWNVEENTLQPALKAYSAANNGQNPNDPSQLAPYLKTPAEQAALQKLIQNQNGARK
ncbi:MAG TPA: hypothetical protein VH598_10725 [Verrucomicrobiae bacterium]|nr:hypothetical protein [Verrucomicrobiae bacterium]